MRIYSPRKKKKKIGLPLLLFLVVILLVPIGGAAVVGYYSIQDLTKPNLSLTPDRAAVSPKKRFTVTASDDQSGIRSLRVFANQGLNKYQILNETYEDQPKTVTKSFTLENSELRGGNFELTAEASDGAFFNFGGGHAATISRKMLLDSSSPNIKPLTTAHYVRQGGVGLVIYSVSKEPERSGVVVGDLFFPGFRQPSGLYLCLFAFPADMNADDFKPRLFIEDTAGNERQAFFVNMAIKRRFREEKTEVSDEFLAKKLPQYAALFPDVKDPVALFLKVNRELRRQNDERLLEIGKATAPQPLWDGPFAYLPGSAVKGSFGALRAYFHNGEKIDEETHLGIDLASKPHAEVPAANSGRVVFAGPLGIYGQTVVIDHGMGLQSLYGHLSDVKIKVGDAVAKGEIIGLTGDSGMAFGDHLHFATLLDGRPIIPIEWWDANWLNDNVTAKMRRQGEVPDEAPSGNASGG